jgi:hypothetical protein
MSLPPGFCYCRTVIYYRDIILCFTKIKERSKRGL